MLYRDCIEKLLQLKDVIVTNIECQGREMHIWLRMEQRMHFCPCCGTITGKVHDYRTQLVKDISISGYDTILHLRKRRQLEPGSRVSCTVSGPVTLYQKSPAWKRSLRYGVSP